MGMRRNDSLGIAIFNVLSFLLSFGSAYKKTLLSLTGNGEKCDFGNCKCSCSQFC